MMMIHTSFDPFPVLETDRLILRKPHAKDTDILFRYRSDKEYMRYIPHRYTTDKNEVARILAYMNEMADKQQSINWVMTLKDSDELIGVIGFVRFLPDNLRAEIGYMTATPYQRCGYTVEALKAVIRYGFDQMKLHSIEAVVNSENEPSGKLLEKLGFSKDAFFKDYLHHAGTFRNAYVFSLVKKEHT